MNKGFTDNSKTINYFKPLPCTSERKMTKIKVKRGMKTTKVLVKKMIIILIKTDEYENIDIHVLYCFLLRIKAL